MYYYVYETTLADGRRYIGSRKSPQANPYKDTKYWGSPRKPCLNWKPIRKRIIAVFHNHGDAIALEVYLHKKHDVAKNPQYYNRARQTSTGFTHDPSKLRLWTHPLHGDYVGTPSDIVRHFANFNYHRGNLTRIANNRQSTPYRGWIHVYTFT